MSTKEELGALKVTELKTLCKEKGLSQVGVKADLVARLAEHSLQKSSPAVEGKDANDTGAKSVTEEKKTSDPGVDQLKAASAEPSPGPTKGSTEDVKTTDNAANEQENDVPKQVTRASHDQVSANPSDTASSDDKDVKQKLIDRAKRFGVPAPELEEEKKIERAKRFGIAAPELDEAKKRERAKRFGVPASDQDKKMERAKRFNLQVPELEAEKMKTRAERFASEKSATELSDEERLRLRAERFKARSVGSAAQSAVSVAATAAAGATEAAAANEKNASKDEEEERKRKRAERFATSAADAEVDKKKQRLERFGTTAAASEDDKKELRAKRFAAVKSS